MQKQATYISFDILVNVFFRHLIWEVASTRRLRTQKSQLGKLKA